MQVPESLGVGGDEDDGKTLPILIINQIKDHNTIKLALQNLIRLQIIYVQIDFLLNILYLSLEIQRNNISNLVLGDLPLTFLLNALGPILLLITHSLDHDNLPFLLNIKPIVLSEVAVGRQQEQEVTEVGQEEEDAVNVEQDSHCFGEVVELRAALKQYKVIFN